MRVLTRCLLSLVFLFSLVSFLFAYDCIVERVIDGDTLICSGEKVRLIGIDTPESSINPHIEKQRSLGDIQTILYYGNLAKKFVEKLVPPGTRVKLEFDIQQRDKYGRLLAYVWLPDGRMLNEVILKEGYAMLYTVPPNVKYENRLRKAYREAVEKRKGLWKF
ncbi:thermonuclease family protein [Caldisericum sp.]|uniref:thermonuclease family protein n=1 Tax=Caldisericum sp. TaxID=2499687 RepID=UPI003D0D5E76